MVVCQVVKLKRDLVVAELLGREVRNTLDPCFVNVAFGSQGDEWRHCLDGPLLEAKQP
jgi:hypothetical protein